MLKLHEIGPPREISLAIAAIQLAQHMQTAWYHINPSKSQSSQKLTLLHPNNPRGQALKMVDIISSDIGEIASKGITSFSSTLHPTSLFFKHALDSYISFEHIQILTQLLSDLTTNHQVCVSLYILIFTILKSWRNNW